MFVNDINVRDIPGSFTLGADNETADEGTAVGFRGTGEVDGTATDGNVVLDFGSLEVDSVSITYRSSANADTDPAGQAIGISNLTFETVAVPEPGVFAVLGLLAPAAFLRRRRNA